MFGGVLNSLTKKLGQTATKGEVGKLAGLIGGEGAIAKSAPKVVPKNSFTGKVDMTPDDINMFREDIKNALYEGGFDDVAIDSLDHIGSTRLGTARPDSDLDLVMRYRGDAREDDVFNLLNDYVEQNGLEFNGRKVDINPIRSDDIEQYRQLLADAGVNIDDVAPYLGGSAGGGNDLLKYMNATNPEFVAKKNLGAKTKSKRINVDEYSQRPQELQQQPVSRVFVSEQGQPISDMPTEVIKTDGGYIRILPNSPYAPENLTSIVKVMVDEGSRRQGIGSDLLKEAMRKYGRISAFAENEASQRMNYKLGMRPVDKPNATLEEVLALGREQGGGVTMVTPARSEVNPRQFNKLGSGRPTNEILDSIAGTKIHPDDMDAMDEFIRYARNKKLRNSLPDDKQAKYELRMYDMADHYGIKLNENATDPIRDMANKFIKAMDKQNLGGK